MIETKKITTILIRLIALTFIIEAIIPFISTAIVLTYIKISSDIGQLPNLSTFIIPNALRILIGLILLAKSKSLATYLTNSLKDDEPPQSVNSNANLPAPQL